MFNWGMAKPKRIRRLQNVSMQLSAEEHRLVRQAVELVGMTKSSWMRMVVVNSARAQVGVAGGAEELMVNAVAEALRSPGLRDRVMRAVGVPTVPPVEVVKRGKGKLRGSQPTLPGLDGLNK